MSQQINLLPPQPGKGLLSIIILGGIVVIGGAVAYANWSGADLVQLRQEAAQSRDAVARTRDALAKVQGKGGGESVAKLEAEIAQLRPRALPAAEFLRQVDAGLLGTTGGYEAHFKAMSAVSDENVWVTKLAITRGGSQVSVTGIGMSNEAVLQFARRATEALRSAGVTAHALDVRPVPATTSSTPPAVTFTLS